MRDHPELLARGFANAAHDVFPSLRIVWALDYLKLLVLRPELERFQTALVLFLWLDVRVRVVDDGLDTAFTREAHGFHGAWPAACMEQ